MMFLVIATPLYHIIACENLNHNEIICLPRLFILWMLRRAAEQGFFLLNVDYSGIKSFVYERDRMHNSRPISRRIPLFKFNYNMQNCEIAYPCLNLLPSSLVVIACSANCIKIAIRNRSQVYFNNLSMINNFVKRCVMSVKFTLWLRCFSINLVTLVPM